MTNSLLTNSVAVL